MELNDIYDEEPNLTGSCTGGERHGKPENTASWSAYGSTTAGGMLTRRAGKLCRNLGKIPAAR